MEWGVRRMLLKDAIRLACEKYHMSAPYSVMRPSAEYLPGKATPLPQVKNRKYPLHKVDLEVSVMVIPEKVKKSKSSPKDTGLS